MKQVILKVEDGIVNAISIPEGVEVILHDYDLDNDINNDLRQIDQYGKDFIEIIFDKDDSSL